jgi:hypothetical protein
MAGEAAALDYFNMTPEQVQARRRALYALGLMNQAGNTGPTTSPWQALSRVTAGALGGWMGGQGGQGGAPAPVTVPQAPAYAGAPAPVTVPQAAPFVPPIPPAPAAAARPLPVPPIPPGQAPGSGAYAWPPFTNAPSPAAAGAAPYPPMPSGIPGGDTLIYQPGSPGYGGIFGNITRAPVTPAWQQARIAQMRRLLRGQLGSGAYNTFPGPLGY